MRKSESDQHKEIKEKISKKLEEWTGAALEEYPSSGHELDVFAITPNGISIYIEIIWSSSRANFYRDLNMIQSSNANIKLVVVSPEILKNNEYLREFEKTAISQRRLNIAMHGVLIDGARILDESDYLETEFKRIIFALIGQVRTRGATIGIKASQQPPKPNSPDEKEERLWSNLFPVKRIPETIFVSTTNLKYEYEFNEKLGQKIRDTPFLAKDRKVYTFDDLTLPSSPFSSVISESEVDQENTIDWIKDSVKRIDLIRILNFGLKKYCHNRGLRYDKKHHRYVCQLRDGKTNVFTWRRRDKFSDREIATCIKGASGDLLYCKHYAANLSFMLLDEDLFLKIEPTLVFTEDGYASIKSHKLVSLMSRYLPKQYNEAYLDLVRFWSKYLSKLDKIIRIPVGDSCIEIDTRPINVSIDVGIAKEEQ